MEEQAKCTEICVKVIRAGEVERPEDHMRAVAVLLAHAIEQDGLAARALERTIRTMAALPAWLSPVNGLIRPAIDSTLWILDRLPSLRLGKLLRLRRGAPRNGAEMIRVECANGEEPGHLPISLSE